MPFPQPLVVNTVLPLCEAAYSFANTGTAVLPDGWRIVQPIRLNGTFLGLLARENPCFGFLAQCGTSLAGVFRGTEYLSEWLDDLNCQAVAFGTQGMAHRGFTDVFNGLSRSLLPKVTDWYGHSLGGALAVLSATRCAGDLVTLACPRVFTTRSMTAPGLRIANADDIVTHSPGRPAFAHRGSAVIFRGGFSLDVARSHSMAQTYRPCLAALSPSYPTVDLA
jgi:lipase (class 3)